jgi:hypothetical protein
MIRIESITINEFRGIRSLNLDFRGKNFAICGPNGTGKSGVVDAIEFALTGKVSRLSGEGRGDISLKQHGPHVDNRDNPEKAYVAIRITIPSLNKTVTVERRLKNPSEAKVAPSDSAILEVLRQVEDHPEITLSRRELIRYVLATPGKRAEEVRALLHLDQVEQVRAGLQKIANNCDNQLSPLNAAVNQARDNLLRGLGISELTKDNVLAAANIHRSILGLSILIDLNESISLKDGLAAPLPAKPQRIPKVQALADIHAALDILVEISSAPITTRATELIVDLTALANDPVLASSVTRETFYATGIDLIEKGACPLCDLSWDLNGLKQHVQAKLDHLNEVSCRRKAAEIKIASLISILRKIQAAINALVSHAILVEPPLTIEAFRDYVTNCGSAIEKLSAFLPLTDTISVLTKVTTVPQLVYDTINAIKKVIEALPDPSKQEAARDWLTLAQERLEVLRESLRKFNIAKNQANIARQVSDIYTKTSDSVLAGIYTEVEKEFVALYGFMNRDDEDKFKAKLNPSLGKLGFDVDFYGRGYFPPGAYHSEGHQDGMGLCLYLALMRYLQGDGFTFTVLDDVLMSVDAGHRREVCSLLKKEFPNTQFIMTTHDPIWLRHMKTECLIDGRAAVQFRSWSVDNGPSTWDDRDVWTEIADHLNKNEVRAGAALLRHYLEYISAELCHRLRASVEFRGDARYQLGEILPAAIARMRKLYSNAKDAASSWDQRDAVQLIADLALKFGQLANSTSAEQWQVNVAVHYNVWDNLGKEDFTPVAESFRQLLIGFTCPICHEYLRVSPDRETPESFRCECGHINLNLRKKPSMNR